MPAVAAGSDTVVESLVINEYLVEEFGHLSKSKLMPGQPLATAACMVAFARSDGCA